MTSKKINRAITFMLLIAASGGAATQSTLKQDAQFSYELIEVQLKICRKHYQLWTLETQAGLPGATQSRNDFFECQKKSETEARQAFDKLNPRVRKSSAKAALKDYQAQLMSAINTMDAKDGETRGAYQVRLSETDQRLETAKQRLLLEL